MSFLDCGMLEHLASYQHFHANNTYRHTVMSAKTTITVLQAATALAAMVVRQR